MNCRRTGRRWTTRREWQPTSKCASRTSPALVLPRINIWAHKRVAPLDGLDDHAHFLVSMRRAQVLVAPQKVTIDGHEFVRADVITPSGVYRAQFVTAVNDYLVGFEFQALSKKEADAIVDTTKSIKFR